MKQPTIRWRSGLITPGIRRIAVTFCVSMFVCVFVIQVHAQDADNYKAAVVKITATVDGKRKVGSGFIVKLDVNGAQILTASHVVEGDPAPQIEFFSQPNTLVTAEVQRIEGGDPRGLALLAIRGKDLRPLGVVALALDTSSTLKGGDDATAIGFPSGGGSWAVSKLTVNARDGRDLILAGAVNEGNSGGPILRNGKVVGVVTGLVNQFVRATPASVVQLTLEGWLAVLEEAIAARPNGLPAGTGLPPQLAKTKIAFAKYEDGKKQIYTMYADGSNIQSLINDSNQNKVPHDCHSGKLPDMESPSWSADGTQLAFEVVVWDDQPGECRTSGYRQIMIIHADGSGARQLTKGQAANTHPVWSPDGTKIAFAYTGKDSVDGSIYVMNSDGSHPSRITGKKHSSDSDPVWSSDGSHIAFISDRDGGPAMYVMNADGTNQRRLTNPTYHIGDLSWSPNGSKIAFALNRAKGQHAEIYVLSVADLKTEQLTNAKDSWSLAPTWSPDGTKIAYVSGDNTNPSHIYVMSSDGTYVSLLSEDPQNPENIAWSTFPKKLK